MKLEGSCHCGAVRFALETRTPQPFMRCYCTICRKTDGGGGYAINIMGLADTLAVTGRRAVRVYQARLPTKDLGGEGDTLETSPAKRHFCGKCGSALWLGDPRWPEWVYPFASAIDTPLPAPPERVHIMLGFKAGWAELPPEGPADRHFQEYPEESIAAWHEKRGLAVE